MNPNPIALTGENTARLVFIILLLPEQHTNKLLHQSPTRKQTEGVNREKSHTHSYALIHVHTHTGSVG